jgi:hypothetical protein
MMEKKMMMQLPFLFVLLWQAVTSSVHIQVMDVNGKGLANVEAALTLYSFSVHGDQLWARPIFSDSCATDKDGKCTIVIGETDTFLRGRIDLGKYGGRDLIWPGGAIDVPIQIDAGRVQFGTEAGPYDFEEDDTGVIIHSTPWLAAFFMFLALGGFAAWIYVKAKQEHA